MLNDYWFSNLKISFKFNDLLNDFLNKYRPRFLDCVGHETMHASSGNKHFFTR